MAERCVAQIVGERQRLSEVFVQHEGARDRPRNLCNLKAVRQPCAVMIALGGDENLRLVHQTSESAAVYDPVAISLKHRPALAFRLGKAPATALAGVAGIGRKASICHGSEPIDSGTPGQSVVLVN